MITRQGFGEGWMDERSAALQPNRCSRDQSSKKKKPDQWLKPYNFPGIGKPIDL
jgi:hypothetical protein